MASGLLDKANIILTPTGYKAGTMYNVAPIEQPYEDFVFSRASVASRVNSSGLVEMVGRTLGSNLVQNGDFSEIGPELVTNGDFISSASWGMQSSWSIASGSANYDGISSHYIEQSNVFLANTNYKITFTISNNTNGIISIRDGVAATLIPNTNYSNGTHTFYITSNTNTTLRIYGVGGSGSLSIDNISVKQLDPNDYWNLETGWSLGDNQAIKTGSVASNFYQYSVFTTGQTYKLTFTISNSNDGRLLVYVGGNSVTEDITNTSDGTYTFYANSDNVNLVFRNVTFEGSITNVTAQEVIDTNNIPRISYDSNGENGHWLLEPTSTNLITYSEDFSQLAWTKDDTIIEGGYTAPDGSNTAYKITNNGSNAHRVGYNGINTGNHKSIWAKTVSGTGDVYLLNRSENNLFSLTNEWQRFDAAHLGLDYFYAVDFRGASTTLSEVIIWGCQLEALPYATSYIPTLTGSTETRATETATGAGSADLINSTEGVLYAEIAALANDGTNRTIALNKDTNDRIQMYFNTSTNGLSIFYKAQSGATAFIINETLTDATSFNKIAFKWKTNDFALWVNGVETDTVSSGVTPTANSLNALEFEMFNDASPFYGKCKALTVFNTALTDAELTELTS